MTHESPFSVLSKLTASSFGVFRGNAAIALGVNRNRLTSFIADGVLERVLPDTYRMTAVPDCHEQQLRAALLWAGDDAAGAGRSAGELVSLQGVRPTLPEIAVPRTNARRSSKVTVHQITDRAALMTREVKGLRVTGIEATLSSLAFSLDTEDLEIACEDARRRRLTSVPALRAYLTRFSRPGRRGTAALGALLDELDPREPSRSTLEVKTRRLLATHRISGYRREFPLEWKGRVHRFDFGFEHARTILETNGRRWHDDPLDYERDNEKWSVPGRLGYSVVFATWTKVNQHPNELVEELAAALAA
jgi:predicted transcriptional regulator of viral defense system